ncbi:DMT family transporter [Nonomuraea sp. NPDC050328]|uniref:DMT family transporter n=1 Tax=Nonomuraea sp. NPDC050328 TaxID=3364361 RepID=UPI00379E2869
MTRTSSVQRRSVVSAGALLCLVSATGFGLSPLFAKEAYAAGVGVPTLLAVRFAVAAALFWVIVAWRRPTVPPRRTLAVAAALGAVGYACQAAFFFGALTLADASLVSLLLYAYPALVTVLAVLLRRESLDVRRAAALACSAAGLVLLLGAGGSAHSAGVLLALGAAVAYSLYLTVAAGLPAGLDLYLLSAIVCTGAAASIGLTASATGTLVLPVRLDAWVWTVVLAVVSTVVPVITMFAGVRAVGAPTAAILSCVEPAITVASTALVYGERLSAPQLAGGLAVLASVAVLQIPGRRALPRGGSGAEPGR